MSLLKLFLIGVAVLVIVLALILTDGILTMDPIHRPGTWGRIKLAYQTDYDLLRIAYRDLGPGFSRTGFVLTQLVFAPITLLLPLFRAVFQPESFR